MLLSINNESYMIIVQIGSYAVAIPILIGMFVGFGYFVYICIKALFETKKWHLVVTAILIIISIIDIITLLKVLNIINIKS